MKASMIDTYTDENGLLDFSRLPHGSGMSRVSEVCFLLDLFFIERQNFLNSGEENDKCSSTCG